MPYVPYVPLTVSLPLPLTLTMSLSLTMSVPLPIGPRRVSVVIVHQLPELRARELVLLLLLLLLLLLHTPLSYMPCKTYMA
jgi:hypothetical protein